MENHLYTAYAVEVEHRGRRFVQNESTTAYVAQVARALTSETPKMGLMFAGLCGNGKTTMIYAIQNLVNMFRDKGKFRDLELQSYRVGLQIIDARDIARTCMAANSDKKLTGEWDALKKKPMICIEDMGKEPSEVQDFGNVLNPVTELIEHRYNAQLFTAITTNLTGAQLREKYGDRVADRLNEMMEIVIFKNDSYRKN